MVKLDKKMEESTSHTAEKMKAELERQLFHLKTLYDVSRDLLGTVEVEAILKNFLLMTTGNFGVIEGFLLLQEIPSQKISEFVRVGFEENLHAKLLESAKESQSEGEQAGIVLDGPALANPGTLPQDIICALPFELDESCSGLLDQLKSALCSLAPVTRVFPESGCNAWFSSFILRRQSCDLSGADLPLHKFIHIIDYRTD